MNDPNTGMTESGCGVSPQLPPVAPVHDRPRRAGGLTETTTMKPVLTARRCGKGLFPWSAVTERSAGIAFDETEHRAIVPAVFTTTRPCLSTVAAHSSKAVWRYRFPPHSMVVTGWALLTDSN